MCKKTARSIKGARGQRACVCVKQLPHEGNHPTLPEIYVTRTQEDAGAFICKICANTFDMGCETHETDKSMECVCMK